VIDLPELYSFLFSFILERRGEIIVCLFNVKAWVFIRIFICLFPDRLTLLVNLSGKYVGLLCAFWVVLGWG